MSLSLVFDSLFVPVEIEQELCRPSESDSISVRCPFELSSFSEMDLLDLLD